jgi:hypothetical protein
MGDALQIHVSPPAQQDASMIRDDVPVRMPRAIVRPHPPLGMVLDRSPSILRGEGEPLLAAALLVLHAQKVTTDVHLKPQNQAQQILLLCISPLMTRPGTIWLQNSRDTCHDPKGFTLNILRVQPQDDMCMNCRCDTSRPQLILKTNPPWYRSNMLACLQSL